MVLASFAVSAWHSASLRVWGQHRICSGNINKGKAEKQHLYEANERKELNEENEFNEKSLCTELWLISLNSSNSFFSLFVSIKDPAGTLAKNEHFCFGSGGFF